MGCGGSTEAGGAGGAGSPPAKQAQEGAKDAAAAEIQGAAAAYMKTTGSSLTNLATAYDSHKQDDTRPRPERVVHALPLGRLGGNARGQHYSWVLVTRRR